MRRPTTIEPDAHLAAAAYVIEHSHDPALVVVTDETNEPVAMVTPAEITRAVAHGRSLVGMVELGDLCRAILAPGTVSPGPVTDRALSRS
jgi:CBS domain-containing protein